MKIIIEKEIDENYSEIFEKCTDKFIMDYIYSKLPHFMDNAKYIILRDIHFE